MLVGVDVALTTFFYQQPMAPSLRGLMSTIVVIFIQCNVLLRYRGSVFMKFDFGMHHLSKYCCRLCSMALASGCSLPLQGKVPCYNPKTSED